MSVEIKVKYLSDVYEEHPLAPVGGDLSCWVDLRSAVDVHLESGQSCLVPLGFAMLMPSDYEAYLAPRSSSFLKYGFVVANSIGIIDNSYCGDDDEWKLSIYAVRDCEIHKGDRIAQFRIQKKMPKLEFITVESLGDSNRGGFGEGTKNYV